MENTTSDIPNEILAIILGNGSYDSLLKYCYSSNKTLIDCNSNYIRNTIINKFLPLGLDYSQYSIEELLQLGKFNAMHCLDLYLYTNANDDILATEFFNSEAYKKGIINTYVLPFMKDDDYNIITMNNGDLDWLLDLPIDNLILLCGILYPIDSILDIMNYQNNILFNMFSRMFWTRRNKEDITDVLEKYINITINNDKISQLFSDSLENFIHFCVKFNREDIINYRIREIINQYLLKYNMDNDLMFIYNKFKDFDYIKMDDVVKEFMKIKSNGGIFSQLYSGYIVNGGVINETIHNVFSNINNIEFMKDWIVNSTSTSQLYGLVKQYLPSNLFDYSNIVSIINEGTLSSVRYMQLVTYVLGESYNDKIFTDALPNNTEGREDLYFIFDSDNVSAIKSMLNKYYPDHFITNTPNIGQFRRLVSIKNEIYKDRDINKTRKINDYDNFMHKLLFYNKLYYMLLYKDIKNITETIFNIKH
ncbi:Hypothetical protein ORPV_293 [Orpheovirus IHUMI-LCC2]|uniref:Uncharacterized protein n=1 Tax=Orpheovirus IHUMI-LCC2 TaxID=2023057 RepID=A0A2I2L3V5_9VIRU|nr:Hypothetical protein ORPV_293 [Orpheovirus IHUMI-LCC2]SNW62197.1 Hypothetical protein ORPV_293 [Orpheovirus IHUMI-LCC2]